MMSKTKLAIKVASIETDRMGFADLKNFVFDRLVDEHMKLNQNTLNELLIKYTQQEKEWSEWIDKTHNWFV